MASIDKHKAEQFFRDNYTPTKCICRDRGLEGYLILRSKVEMALLARLAAGVLDPWQGRLTATDGVCRCNVRLPSRLACADKQRWHDCPRPGETIDGGPCNLRHFATDNFSTKVDVVLGRTPTRDALLGGIAGETEGARNSSRIVHRENLDYPLREVDGALGVQGVALAEFLYLLEDGFQQKMGMMPKCIAACRTRLADRMTKIVTVVDASPIGVRLVHLFCLLSGELRERTAVELLAHRLGIRDDVFDYHSWFDRRRGWRQYEDMARLGDGELAHPLDDKAWFHCAHDAKGICLETIHRDPLNKTILPITAWTKETTECRYYLNLPPWKPRLHGLGAILTSRERDATVFLTDTPEMAVANRLAPAGRNAVWASWYGEMEAVGRMDWSCLKGRNVFYILAPQRGCDQGPAYRTAYAVYDELAQQRGTTLTFVEIGSTEAGLDGNATEPVAMSSEQFYGYARSRLGLDAPLPIRGFTPRTMQDLAEGAGRDRGFLLEPIIHERSTTLVYAWTSVGKTWFALCVGVTIAQGATLFGRWKAKKPLKVLYIDSEMDEDSVRNRMRLVSRMRFDGRTLRRDRLRNIFYISRKRSQADIDTFKKDTLDFVERTGVSLVILDNLTAFTQHDDSARAWEDIHVWIDCLKEKGKGCAVLLVHHENKKGDQRGTSATTNAVDNVIHLRPWSPAEADESLASHRTGKPSAASALTASANPVDGEVQPENGALYMKIEVEKGRDIYGVAKQILTAVISPSSSPPYCGLVPDKAGGGSPPGATAPGEAPRKRGYRKGLQRDALMQAALSMLSDRGAKDVAHELGVSVQWVYGIPGRKDHPNWKASREGRKASQRARNDSIIERATREHPSAIAADLLMSPTSVRRIIDKAWIERIEMAAPFMEGKSPEDIASELKTSAGTIRRLTEEIRLRQVASLHGNGMAVTDIARKLGVPAERVQTKCNAIESADWKAKQRCEDKAKVVRLHAEGNSDVEVIKMTGLSRRTVVRWLNKLDPSRRKPKRNTPPAPSAPPPVPG
jgi:transposase